MKKVLLITVFLSIILSALSLTINHIDSNGFTMKGYPFIYTKTIDTHGLCIGYIDETKSDDCGKREFPVNKGAASLDVLISISVSAVLTLVIWQFRHKLSLEERRPASAKLSNALTKFKTKD